MVCAATVREAFSGTLMILRIVEWYENLESKIQLHRIIWVYLRTGYIYNVEVFYFSSQYNFKAFQVFVLWVRIFESLQGWFNYFFTACELNEASTFLYPHGVTIGNGREWDNSFNYFTKFLPFVCVCVCVVAKGDSEKDKNTKMGLYNRGLLLVFFLFYSFLLPRSFFFCFCCVIFELVGRKKTLLFGPFSLKLL